MSTHTYSIANDTANAVLNAADLKLEIENSSISKSVQALHSDGDVITIQFSSTLLTPEELTLDAVLSSHQGLAVVENIQIPLEIDEEGRQISRLAAGKKGWVYMSHPIEIATSKVGGSYSSDYTDTARTDYTLQLYDSSGTLITDQATADTDCVKTVITFTPQYDYEIISGNIYQKVVPTTDVRLWVVGGAFHVAGRVPVSVKEFVSGFNLAFLGVDDHIETDGRASKQMVKDITQHGLPFPTYQGNGFQYIVRHDAGEKHDIMITMEYFRA